MMAALPEAYRKEIQALDRSICSDQPKDVLQYCADFFLNRLASERKSLLLLEPSSTARTGKQLGPPPAGKSPRTMAAPFATPFGANPNPFGGSPFDASSSIGTGPATMQRVLEDEEADTVASPTTAHFAQHALSGSEFQFGAGDTLSDSVHPMAARLTLNHESFPAQYNFGRRTSVSAESLKPSADTNDSWSPPYHEKTADQLGRLKTSIENNFLFSHLNEEQSSQILGALVEKHYPAKDIKVINQGEAGDYFYIVEKGSFDVYIHESGSLQPGPDGMGKKVTVIPAGGSFGELALMYNAPRAATVISAEPNCTVWLLDRNTFRRILMESTFSLRRLYESFLSEVPLLSTLTPYERSRIADALETQRYSPGSVIIREGEPGYSFYLLESGEADAYKGDPSNIVKRYRKGDFFGELALLNDAPRAATVVARTNVKTASLGKNAFQRLLGPVESIMRRTKYEGAQTGVEEVDPLAPE